MIIMTILVCSSEHQQPLIFKIALSDPCEDSPQTVPKCLLGDPN